MLILFKLYTVKQEEDDGDMGIIYNPSKIMKLVPFILIIGDTSNKDTMESFHQNIKALGGF